VDRVVDLVDEPWDASVMPPGDDPAFRMTVFDAGYGLLSFYADDIAGIITIFDITWIGSSADTARGIFWPRQRVPDHSLVSRSLSSILTRASRLRALGAIHSLVTDDGP
jgi:hypothetical protein